VRVLIINSMFASSVYRRCADELGSHADIELTVLTVDAWVMNSKVMPLDPPVGAAPYKLIAGRAAWRGKENRGFYVSGLVRAILESRPEVIFLMEEPFSIFALQCTLLCRVLAPEARIINFTWNNLSLREFDYRPTLIYRTIARYVLPKLSFALTANLQGVEVLRAEGFTKPAISVGYGVDSDAFDRERYDPFEIRRRIGFDPNQIVIGYVGRLKWMKGLDLLIAAIAKIRERNSNVRLLIVGSGEDEAAIYKSIKSAGLDDIVTSVSAVTQTSVPEWMQAIDILVLPSRRVGMWAEQFGRVLVEAMAAGKVVIGSTSGAIPEVIGDGGFTFKENDADDLVRTIECAITLPDQEKLELLERARIRAREHYTWKRFAADVRSAILHIAGKEGASAH
jgi:glycosyltransferase involved in cell wall biosynthesis